MMILTHVTAPFFNIANKIKIDNQNYQGTPYRQRIRLGHTLVIAYTRFCFLKHSLIDAVTWTTV